MVDYRKGRFQPTPEQQDERDVVKARHLQTSPGARYWPATHEIDVDYLDDGTIDVRALCRALDTHFNEGIE